MRYQVRYSPSARQDLSSLAKTEAKRVSDKIAWLAEHFENLKPEPLSGELRGLFKLRVGSYRILYTFDNNDRLIFIRMVGHWRDIYERI